MSSAEILAALVIFVLSAVVAGALRLLLAEVWPARGKFTVAWRVHQPACVSSQLLPIGQALVSLPQDRAEAWFLVGYNAQGEKGSIKVSRSRYNAAIVGETQFS